MLSDILSRLISKSGKNLKQIATEMNVTEKTLKRMISGSGTPNLFNFTTFLKVCGADINDVVDIFAEIQFFMVRYPVAEINQENENLMAELQRARDELDLLKSQLATAMADKELLREKNDALKDQIIDIHNYYIKSRN